MTANAAELLQLAFSPEAGATLWSQSLYPLRPPRTAVASCYRARSASATSGLSASQVGKKHAPLQSRHGRYLCRRGSRRHRSARRPRRGHSRRHPTLAHQRCVLPRRRRDGISGRLQSGDQDRARAPGARCLRHRRGIQAPLVRQLGTAPRTLPLSRRRRAHLARARDPDRSCAPLHRRSLPRPRRCAA